MSVSLKASAVWTLCVHVSAHVLHSLNRNVIFCHSVSAEMKLTSDLTEVGGIYKIKNRIRLSQYFKIRHRTKLGI